MRLKFVTFVFSVFFVFTGSLSAKIRILTFHFNRPDFLEMQCKTFKEFMRDDYEIIVFNDAPNEPMASAIEKACEKYGVQCVRYEQERHAADPLNDYILEIVNDPSLIHSHVNLARDRNEIYRQPTVRHCHVIQYAMDGFGYEHDDIVVIADGDLFPIRPIHLKELLKDNPIIGINRRIGNENCDYLWVPFIAFDTRRLPDKRELKFHLDRIGEYLHDTGAHTYHYLKNHPDLSVRKYDGHSSSSFYGFSREQMQPHGFNVEEMTLVEKLPWPVCVEFHLEHRFLHFGASSFELEGHDVKSHHVIDFLNKITKRLD